MKLMDVTFIHLMLELTKEIFSMQNVGLGCEFYYKYTFGKSASPLNLDISTISSKQTGGNQWINAALDPLCLD